MSLLEAPCFARLTARYHAAGSLLALGLDPSLPTLQKFAAARPHLPRLDDSRAPNFLQNAASVAESFCKYLIDEAEDYIIAVKPNSAFFEALGHHGFQTLRTVCQYARSRSLPVILDSKRGDIGSTSEAYASAAWDYFEADYVTVSPYLGWEGVQPFLKRDGKGVFVLCRTSNRSSTYLQTLVAHKEQSHGGDSGEETPAIYQLVANEYLQPQARKSVGLVVGATQTDALSKIRGSHHDVWILAPGLGAQGGDMKEAVRQGVRPHFGGGVIFPMSRGLAEAKNVREAAKEARDAINRIVEGMRHS